MNHTNVDPWRFLIDLKIDIFLFSSITEQERASILL